MRVRHVSACSTLRPNRVTNPLLVNLLADSEHEFAAVDVRGPVSNRPPGVGNVHQGTVIRPYFADKARTRAIARRHEQTVIGIAAVVNGLNIPDIVAAAQLQHLLGGHRRTRPHEYEKSDDPANQSDTDPAQSRPPIPVLDCTFLSAVTLNASADGGSIAGAYPLFKGAFC